MKLRRRARRAGISELVGSLLAIAITIIAGAAVFGFVNGQAGTTEQQYGVAAGQTAGFLAEKFVVPLLTFPNSTSVTVWVYNSGSINFNPVQILFYNSTKSCTGSCTSISLQYNATAVADVNHAGCEAASTNENPVFSAVELKPGGLMQITLKIPQGFSGTGCTSGYQLSNGGVYYVNIVGAYGNVVTYFQVKGH